LTPVFADFSCFPCFCNSGDWFCDGTLTTGTAATSNNVAERSYHYTDFADTSEAYNHYTNGAWGGIVGVVRADMVNSQSKPSAPFQAAGNRHARGYRRWLRLRHLPAGTTWVLAERRARVRSRSAPKWGALDTFTPDFFDRSRHFLIRTPSTMHIPCEI
jgi:hypothetical protein